MTLVKTGATAFLYFPSLSGNNSATSVFQGTETEKNTKNYIFAGKVGKHRKYSPNPQLSGKSRKKVLDIWVQIYLPISFAAFWDHGVAFLAQCLD